MPSKPETNFGHYRIISAIGKGGMGEVYLAQDTKLDRKVAIKFLSEKFSQDADKLNRFIQEAKAASALNHPNILTVFEIGEFENTRFIVTEHIDGKTLSDILERDRPKLQKVLNYAIQITTALAAAHEAGIIHRDIKPNNVMIRRDGIVKLLDFGLAKLTFQNNISDLDPEAATLARVMTVPGMLIGTPNYMSPEQARGRAVDIRTDIFSFGILFFEMLTGKRPFDGESYADIMGSILKDEPPPLAQYIEDVPPALEQIVTKTLRKDSDQRYQNIKDLVIDLKDLKDNLKFEAKLIHSSSMSKSDLMHSTDSVQVNPTVQINPLSAIFGRLSVWHLIVMFLLPLLTFGGIYWLVKGRTEEPGVAESGLYKTTDIVSWNSAAGELFSSGAFSPDGRTVAYSSTQSGTKNIWIKQTSSGEAIQITKDSFNNQNPVWSPEGNEIAYFSDRGNGDGAHGNVTGIWRIPTFGGTPVSVAAIADGSSQIRFWSKTGKIYYESNKNLYAVVIESGNITQITNFQSNEVQIKLICISSDEKQIAYVQSAGNSSKVMISSTSGGDPKEIVQIPNEIGGLVWHPDNRRVLYSAYIDRTFQVFSVGIDSLMSKQITFSERNSIVVDVSKDGTAALFGSAKEELNLWKVNAETLEENSVATSIESELWASVSPSNDKIAYQSVKNLSQGNNLFSGSILIKLSKSDNQPLIIAENGFLPEWSPDGNRLAFLRNDGENMQIWSVNATGGKEEKLTEGGVPPVGHSILPYNRIQTTEYNWSPDGKSIAYISNRNGFTNIWNVSSDRSSDLQLTDNKENLLLYCPIWSMDGSKIAFFSKSKLPDEEGKILQSLWFFDNVSKQTKKIYEKSAGFRLIGWNESANALVFASPSKFMGLPPKILLSEVNILTGKELLISDLKDTYYYNIQLSHNNKSIAFVSRQDEKDNIWIFDLKTKKMRKITNNNDTNLYFSSVVWSPDGRSVFYGKQTRFSVLSLINNFK
ncbi:hypothetical protein BH10ACI1_BH10ACI1_12750 [soil metagenome]